MYRSEIEAQRTQELIAFRIQQLAAQGSWDTIEVIEELARPVWVDPAYR